MGGELERRLRDEGLDPSAWSNQPGDRYPAHEHGYDKVIVVDRGSIQFELPSTAETIELEVNDRLELPAGTLHEAAVGPAGVSCLEAHLRVGTLARPGRRPAGAW